jgi:DNA-directed RNA polymerase sigma subunit (sigma70/sigma32)
MASEEVSAMLKKILDDLMGVLPPIGRQVLELRYGLVGDNEPMSHDDIAERLSITVAEVEHYEQAMMDKLRHPSAD